MTLQTVILAVLTLAAFGYSGYRLWILHRLLRNHRGQAQRGGQLAERVASLAIYVFAQKSVLEKRGIGFVHLLIFWGFLLLSLGTLEQFAGAFQTGFRFEFIGEVPYRIFALSQDLFAGLVGLAVLLAWYRRHIIRPEGLGKSRDADIILGLIAGIVVALLLGNASSVCASNPWFASAMPISNWLGARMADAGLSIPAAEVLASVFRWLHLLLVLTFVVYIPGSKHLHILAAAPNIFFRHLGGSKTATRLDFEHATEFGASRITDFSWKDVLDYYACTECGRCQDVCPAYRTQKPLSPKMLIRDLKDQLREQKEKVLAGKHEELSPVLGSDISDDTVWSCTFCRACEVACPVFIDHTDKLLAIRRNLVLMKSSFPEALNQVFRNLEATGNPWAFSSEKRMDWAAGLPVKTIEQDPKADVLLWVGCAGAFDPRAQKVTRAVANLLRKAGVKFAVLGSEEKCTGDVARRLGNEYLFEQMARANIETLSRRGIKRIITACPHCFHSLGNEYRAFGGDFEVSHHSDFLAQLVKDGKLKPNKGTEQTLTYHDSCYLSRWNGIYDAPRSILKALPAARFVEMQDHHQKAMCCGAGGGRMWIEERFGVKINRVRSEQALAAKAGTIATACPFCMSMLQDGLQFKGMGEKTRVLDLAELLDSATH